MKKSTQETVQKYIEHFVNDMKETYDIDVFVFGNGDDIAFSNGVQDVTHFSKRKLSILAILAYNFVSEFVRVILEDMGPSIGKMFAKDRHNAIQVMMVTFEQEVGGSLQEVHRAKEQHGNKCSCECKHE